DSKKTPLPRLLLSQYYQSLGYCSNLLVARTVEQVLDDREKLSEFHDAVAALADKPWETIHQNVNPFALHLYAGASKVAPDLWPKPENVKDSLLLADRGEIFNAQVLVDTMLKELSRRETQTKKPARILLVLDESGQWIEDDAGRLAQLQAL